MNTAFYQKAVGGGGGYGKLSIVSWSTLYCIVYVLTRQNSDRKGEKIGKSLFEHLQFPILFWRIYISSTSHGVIYRLHDWLLIAFDFCGLPGAGCRSYKCPPCRNCGSGSGSGRRRETLVACPPCQTCPRCGRNKKSSSKWLVSFLRTRQGLTKWVLVLEELTIFLKIQKELICIW